jgi:hypothetical protein
MDELVRQQRALFDKYMATGTVRPAEAASPARRRRTPSVATLVKRAEKTGKPVTSVTTPDGTTLRFGEAEQAHGGPEANGDGIVPLTAEELRKLI